MVCVGVGWGVISPASLACLACRGQESLLGPGFGGPEFRIQTPYLACPMPKQTQAKLTTHDLEPRANSFSLLSSLITDPVPGPLRYLEVGGRGHCTPVSLNYWTVPGSLLLHVRGRPEAWTVRL